jgi:hypothetical protein
MEAASLEVLEKANVPAQQARAIVQAIEIELTGARNTLATKQDLTELRLATKQDLTEFRLATKQDVTELRVETKVELARLETKIEASTQSTLWHLYTALLAQLGVLLSATYFFVTHLKP